MKKSLLGFALLLFATAATNAIELEKVERTIGTQPKYLAPDQGYVLLVFGESAERTWLVFDGEILYVDRNGDGDLIDSNETIRPTRIDEEASIYKVGPVGATKKYNLLVMRIPDQIVVVASLPGERIQVAESVKFSTLANKAPIIHFDGTITIAALDGGLSVAIGQHAQLTSNLLPGIESEFYAQLGTPGIGEGAFASLAYIKTSFDEFCKIVQRESMEIPPMLIPEGVFPRLDIEFKNADASKGPIKRHYFLKERC